MVVYPVIPKGELILRIIPTAMHTLEDVEYTLNAFSAIRDKLVAGEYIREMPDMSDMTYDKNNR
jgi:glycine C-acetyltransferase